MRVSAGCSASVPLGRGSGSGPGADAPFFVTGQTVMITATFIIPLLVFVGTCCVCFLVGGRFSAKEIKQAVQSRGALRIVLTLAVLGLVVAGEVTLFKLGGENAFIGWNGALALLALIGGGGWCFLQYDVKRHNKMLSAVQSIP